VSTNGSGNSSNATDWDGDGCKDATTEDLDDDNDGIVDVIDQCQYSLSNWRSTETTDEDADGCEDTTQDTDDDGTIDKYDQCPNTANQTEVDDKGCSLIQIQEQINQYQDDREQILSYIERLSSGELDAIGILLAITIPMSGLAITAFYHLSHRVHIRRLRKVILNAEAPEQLHEAKALLRKSVADERLTESQYNLLHEEIDVQLEILMKAESEDTTEKSESARNKRKVAWNKTIAEELKDDSYRIDDDGTEWWEDEKKQWWHRQPGEGLWSKWVEEEKAP
jgi:hypothetical protein